MQDGNLSNVEWDSPAFKAGLVPGMHLVAVNGETYTPDKLKQAILKAEKETTPINLLMKDRDQIKTGHRGLPRRHALSASGARGVERRIGWIAILKPVE